MSIQTLSKSPPSDSEAFHSGNGSPRPTENYGSYLQKYQYSSWPEFGKDSPPKTNTQSSTKSTITNAALDYIAKVGVSTCDITNELVLRTVAASHICKEVSERYEFQRIGERWEQNQVVKRYQSNGQLYRTTESVYHPGHLELRPTTKLISDEFLEAFSKAGPQTEIRSLTDIQWDNITRKEAIVGVSTMGTAAASLCALAAYCYFSIFK